MAYDLLLHGGRVFDPQEGKLKRLDVGIRGRRITALAPELPLQNARWHADVSGRVVSPGFVDLHIHSYAGATFWGIQADTVCPRGGVTTAVDAGSAGAYNFPGFVRHVVGSDQTKALAFINISGMGLVNPFHELARPEYANAERTVDIAERYEDTVVGVKIRIAENIVFDNFDWAMSEARKAADAIAKPLMVHIGTQPPTLGEILAYLKPGDIITHCFTGRPNRIVDSARLLRDDVRRLIDHGVRLDVGHGSGSFSFPVAEALYDQGIKPYSISSDLHSQSVNGPVYVFTNVLEKFLYLGLSLEEILTRVTINPAKAIGRDQEIGGLAEGGLADLTVLDVENGAFLLTDSDGIQREAKQHLRVRLTVAQGSISFADETMHLIANPDLGGNPAVTGQSVVEDL